MSTEAVVTFWSFMEEPNSGQRQHKPISLLVKCKQKKYEFV